MTPSTLDSQDIPVFAKALAVCRQRSRSAMEDPLDPPAEAPWAEVERRVCASPAGDPKALRSLTRGVPSGATRAQMLAAVSAAYSRHVLVERDPQTGFSLYKVYSPVHPEELIGQAEEDVEYREVAGLALNVSTTPSGYSVLAVHKPCATGAASRTHVATGASVSAALSAALSWAYAGLPLRATAEARPMARPAAPTVAVPRTQQYRKHPSEEYSGLRRGLGWLLRWVVSYVVMALYLLAVLGAAAHMWVSGEVVVDEVLVIAKGFLWAGLSGTAIKYAGVYIMSGLPGVSEELGHG